MNVAVIVPTLNAESYFAEFLNAIRVQTLQPKRLIVIDSSSKDRTVDLARQAGAEIVSISREDFNHGRTRMLGVNQVSADCNVVVFLTQDAILADHYALERLVSAFECQKIDAAYGRQLPRIGANAIEAFSREFNYPAVSEDRCKNDILRLGFKACFCSNSFAAYRVPRLLEVGGFPDDCIFGEDALTVGKMILSESVIRYQANACVYHSHSYTIWQEFKRYFDIGVMHEQNMFLIEQFGSPSSAGRAYVKGEMSWLIRSNRLLIPEMLIRTLVKFVAYKLGRGAELLPRSFRRTLSMNTAYWG